MRSWTLYMRHMSWMVTTLVFSLAGCSSDSTAPNPDGGSSGGSSSTITVGNDFFNPTPDSVTAGAVTFRWVTPSNGHTLTWDSGPGTLPANTGTITSGTRSVTLQPGIYQYHCSNHGSPGSGMHGTIVVR